VVPPLTYIHTNLYSAKNRENEFDATAMKEYETSHQRTTMPHTHTRARARAAAAVVERLITAAVRPRSRLSASPRRRGLMKGIRDVRASARSPSDVRSFSRHHSDGYWLHWTLSTTSCSCSFDNSDNCSPLMNHITFILMHLPILPSISISIFPTF